MWLDVGERPILPYILPILPYRPPRPVRSLSDQSKGLKTTLNWFFSRNSRSVVRSMRLDEREDGALDRAAGGEQLRRGTRVGGDELL